MAKVMRRHPAREQFDHRVVVVGGGFAGLRAVRALKRAPVRVTLVDRRNHHVFQPLLYQVAAGTLSPANVCAPLRTVLRRQRNAEVLLGEVVGFDVHRRKLLLSDGQLPYDTLVLAAGSRYNYFGKPWEKIAPSLKSVEDAIEMRRRILLSLERAEREADPGRREDLLRFVIIGGGPTGVELAGALAEIARYSIVREFRHVHKEEFDVVLLEGLERILSGFPPQLSEKARRCLQAVGVQVRTGCLASEIGEDGVTVKCGNASSFVPTHNVFWTAGVRSSPLTHALSLATGAELDRSGRVVVAPNLTVPGHDEIFAIGDLAHFAHGGDSPLPGLAPVAIQQGKHVARTIARRLRGRPDMPFRYRDHGTMATIGRSAAVADFGALRFNGLLAWLFVHLMQLVTYQNRVLVFIQWAWHYLTFSRSSQLLTAEQEETEVVEPAPRQP